MRVEDAYRGGPAHGKGEGASWGERGHLMRREGGASWGGGGRK